MGGGDSITSKVIEDEEDLRSDGCRRGRGEEGGFSSHWVGATEEVSVCFWRLAAGAAVVAAVASFQHVCVLFVEWQ